MDLGSGAGFPGLPMAIMRPDWSILLAEPRRKRLEFLEEVIDLMGLKNVSVYPHKVTAEAPVQVESIVSRDFGSCSEIVALAASLLPPGGQVHMMKGKTVDREIKQAASTPAWQEFGDLLDRSYSLGADKIQRRLISLVKGGSARPEPLRPRRKVAEIASAANPKYKGWLKLLEPRNIRKTGEAVVSGEKIVSEFLAHDPKNVSALLAVKRSDYARFAVPEEVEIHHLRPEIFPRLDLFGAGPPLLIIKALAPPPWRPEEPWTGMRLFVPFQDPVNVGAVIRSAAALGAEVVLLKEAATPYHPKALRASGPAVRQTKLWSGPALADLSQLPDIYALSPKGRNIRAFNPPKSLGLVVGLEGPGLDDLFPEERRLAIPMKPGVESLNAAVAAAVAMALLTTDDFQ
ncbi:MAG: class I SAM-dependent methyltransferase [Deltaproteobacteria bacterium]|jgi:16S rRNA (guanine(527)-N(7))-methyltransferase RsmG|nr:class I SAM-dependent methyltransferase [Deltaproteobacteria bacterium]